MNIGIFGIGVVGTAVYNGFIDKNKIFRYDTNLRYDNIRETVSNSEIIFVCVPTPSNNNKYQNRIQQDLSYVNNAVDLINTFSITDRKTIVIKSTITPGTTRRYALRYPRHNFVFNPEFLTARTANEDFLKQVQIILGGDELDKVEQLYKETFPETLIRKISWEEAELFKYTCNVFGAVKVTYANQIYKACNKLNISYDVIKNLFIDNGWVNPMHLDVPGPDSLLGFGGACFPKDIQAFIAWGEDQGIREVL